MKTMTDKQSEDRQDRAKVLQLKKLKPRRTAIQRKDYPAECVFLATLAALATPAVPLKAMKKQQK